MNAADTVALVWFSTLNAATFLAFGFDKWRASHAGRRVPEFTLLGLSALGGWLGGVVAMKFFRHKTAKRTFKLGFLLTVIPLAAEVWAWFHWR